MRKFAKIFQGVLNWPFYAGLIFFTDFKVEGQENLKGLETKPVIFASNHCSYIDSQIACAAMPRYEGDFYPKHFFPVRFLTYKEFFHFKNRFPFPLSWFVAVYVRLNASIKVFNANGDLNLVLGETINALKSGDKIWIYPEGQLSKDGKLGQGKRGVAFLQRQTGLPVVPVAMIGTFGILSKNTLLRKNKVVVKIGKPFYLPPNCSLEQGSAMVMREIERLYNI